jgi:hypothetical protein
MIKVREWTDACFVTLASAAVSCADGDATLFQSYISPTRVCKQREWIGYQFAFCAARCTAPPLNYAPSRRVPANVINKFLNYIPCDDIQATWKQHQSGSTSFPNKRALGIQIAAVRAFMRHVKRRVVQSMLLTFSCGTGTQVVSTDKKRRIGYVIANFGSREQ